MRSNRCLQRNRAATTCLALALIFLVSSCSAPEPETSETTPEEAPAEAALREALTFHASFDNGADADFGAGDHSIYTAPSYKEQDQAAPGIGSPDIEIASGAGRFGDGLRFNKKNTQALFYRAEGNVPYTASDWTGTISFWLSLDPAVDLEPGFCDPIQVTDSAYNDAAIWVDFTRENPRQFRLGVFGELSAWNPENVPPDENPDFENRLVVVENPPFARDKWTHVVITHAGLGSASGGSARLYLDGKLRGAAEGVTEPFTWDLSRAAIRLGVNYVGLYDEVAVFNRALSQEEVLHLHQLEGGVASLHP